MYDVFMLQIFIRERGRFLWDILDKRALLSSSPYDTQARLQLFIIFKLDPSYATSRDHMMQARGSGNENGHLRSDSVSAAQGFWRRKDFGGARILAEREEAWEGAQGGKRRAEGRDRGSVAT